MKSDQTKTPPIEIHVGRFRLGNEHVDLFLIPGKLGGEVDVLPREKTIARIEIGADRDYWWETVEVLLHEAAEFVMYRAGLRFKASGQYAADHASYLFVMDHCQFSDVTAKVAAFMAEAMPRLAEVWNKHKRNRKKNHGS